MIVDCFTFFREFDLLELRLRELDGIVDYFVLCEADRTHTFRPKPMHFWDNRERFAPWQDRILHVPMTDYDGLDTGNPRAIEYAQHQRALDVALDMIVPGDLLIYGDCDEIPRASAIRAAQGIEFRSAALETPLYYYWLNFRCANKNWRRLKVVRWAGDRLHHRQIRYRSADASIADAGWHFSYVSSAEAIKEKIDAFAHTEYAVPPFNTVEYIREKVEQKQDLFGRSMDFVIDPLEQMPQYVRENRERYGRLLL